MVTWAPSEGAALSGTENDSNTSCYTDIPEMSLFLYADELPLHSNCPLASLLQKLILLKLMC